MKLYDQDFIDTPFYGDGRKKVSPTRWPRGTIPRMVRKAEARSLIQTYLLRGTHSDLPTVWVIVEFCESTKRPYSFADNMIKEK